MIKLLVADDEHNIRKGLMNYIEWESLGIEIVGEAVNGEQALSKCIELKPDIVITDIKMPKCDGLQFAKKIKEIYPDTIIIIMSGFEDLKYYKDAISIGVFEYLNKPVSLDTLMLCVSKAKEQVLSKQIDQVASTNILDDQISIARLSLVHHLCTSKNTPIELINNLQLIGFPSSSHYCFSLIKYILPENVDFLSNFDIDIIRWNVSQIAEKVATSYENIYIDEISPETFIVFLGGDKDICAQDAKTASANLLNDITRLTSCKTLYALSEVFDSLKHVQKQYEKLSGIVNNCFWLTDEQNYIINHMHDTNVVNLNTNIFLSSENDLIQNFINNKEWDQELCERYLSNAEDLKITEHEFKFSLKRLISIKYSSNDDTLRRFFDAVNAYSNGQSLVQWADDKLFTTTENNDTSYDITDKLNNFISNNYSNKITLSSMAREHYISANYLGKLIKEQTGLYFHEHLHQYRLKMAAQLLSNTDMQIIHISESVGYTNYKYFSLCFLKQFGCSSRDYRKRNKTT